MVVLQTGPAHRTSTRARRIALVILVVAWGAQAIVTQSLLLREALVLMFGSEFAWGVVLFAWLLGVALGAVIGGWLAESTVGTRHADLALVAVLVALSVAGCAELWVFRGARSWLGVPPGELLPLPQTALAAVLFVSPASALVGMSFPLACCVARVPRPGAAASSLLEGAGDGRLLTFGQVYALESLGSLLGGAAFSFWAVEHLTPIQTALVCGGLTTVASTALLAKPPRKLAASAGLAVVGLGALVTAVFAGGVLNRGLVERRWQNIAPGYELVAEAESKYQNLAVGQRAGQYTLYCDGHISADFPDPYTFAPLAHFWLCQHPAPRHVLVLGGGAEGLLSEVLHHPIEHVDYVEPDPRQIELVEPYLAEPDRQALGDSRVTVHHADARYYVKTQRSRFDLIVARLPEPTSALRARFYTQEFYRELRRAMTPRSVLCLTATAAPGELSDTSRPYLASIRATLRRHFPEVVIGWGDPAQVLAATQPGLISTDPAELTARYERRSVVSKMFHPAWFDGATDWLDPDKLALRAADLDAATDVEISTDLRPSIYVQRLILWEAQSAPLSRRARSGAAPLTLRRGMIARLRTVRVAELAAALIVLGGVTLIVSRLRRHGPAGWATGAVTLSLGTTGFATMALSIVWLFAFQNLYGYVYQRIGWIIALFMAGLVIGCVIGNRHTNGTAGGGPCPPYTPESGGRCPPYTPYAAWRQLIGVDLLLALLALTVPLVLPVLAALQTGRGTFLLVEGCISIMVVLTGLLGGAAFPLAARLQLTLTGRTGASAGAVVGADHAGACLGALLCGLLLVPVFGMTTTAFVLAGVKLTSAAVLIAPQRLLRAA